jgi:ribonuclease HI
VDYTEYTVWCDGSCSPNPGPGGWGAIIDNGGERRELSGASPSTTNNIMEMSAAIAALETIPAGASVHITTDSRYLMDGITRWLEGWKRKGWRKSNGAPVLNRAYWEKLETLRDKRSVEWAWVRGHSGHPENERCDELANEARKALSYP